jgi:glycosyltransferase involved in cell wall biosynthesis
MPCFDELRLLAFGMIRENKGVRTAIDAVKRVNLAAGRLRVRLTVAGRPENAADEAYWADCRAEIAGAPEMFNVVDRYIEDGEIRAFVEDHHALILPYSEFFSDSGVAALALSLERPILATEAGGLADLVKQSGAAIRIDAPTVEAAAAAIDHALLLGREALEEMGWWGGRFIRHERCWLSIAARTAAIYTRLGAAPSPFNADPTPTLEDRSPANSDTPPMKAVAAFAARK